MPKKSYSAKQRKLAAAAPPRDKITGAGKNPKSEKAKARRKSYYARHNAQDPNPGFFTARYWSHRTKW